MHEREVERRETLARVETHGNGGKGSEIRGKDVAVNVYQWAPVPEFEQCITGASVSFPRTS
jgi:hypothetical protein